MSMSEKAERKTSGKKRTRKNGEGTWNRKIKEEERRRRSADDDNGSGQGAVERGGRRERRKIASSEYGRGIRVGKGGEKRLPDGTPQRSGGSIDPECRRPPARNALFYSFATQSLSSLFSPLLPPPDLSSFSSCLAFTILSSLFSLPASVLLLLLFHFILLILPFFSLSRFVTFTFISINLSLF